jgi:hypothetical protein
VFVIHSPQIENRMNGPDTTSLLAKMKNQPRMRKNAAPARAFRPWRFGCISFFAAQRDAFCRPGEMALMRVTSQLEIALARGDNFVRANLRAIPSRRASLAPFFQERASIP